MAADAIFERNAPPSASASTTNHPPQQHKRRGGNKFKRKFIVETKSRPGATAGHVISTFAADEPPAPAPVAPRPSPPPSQPTKSTLRPSSAEHSPELEDASHRTASSASSTICPPPLPPPPTTSVEGVGNETIGFITEWINAYIFLARKFPNHMQRKEVKGASFRQMELGIPNDSSVAQGERESEGSLLPCLPDSH